jgi:hypothetical protein
MYLPGENALCLSQSINYLLPAFIGDEITVEGEVITKSSATRIITLKTIIRIIQVSALLMAKQKSWLEIDYTYCLDDERAVI